ncbi:unnamed protein product [Cylindrotheca closterium]|uniref:Uncharacterized protein n=1 Tax=Cylindrotheca closterium TaxID=2856 RepID=A0AAD2JJS8_9STRA|nr:unnamed protein product [Cylindrotheca closterium]
MATSILCSQHLLLWVSVWLTCMQLIELKSVPSYSADAPDRTRLKKHKTCTHKQLWKAFGNGDSQDKKIVDDEGTCWDLRKEMMNIPVEKIMNRRNYDLIGLGHHGAIAKVLIQYGSHRSNVCEAVVKTDKCNPIAGGDPLSCIAPNAMNRIQESYLGSEYMGGLPFASRRRMGVPTDGILPVWGVVYKKGGLPSHSNHSEWIGRPHPDPEVIGIVLPLTKFTPLNSGDSIATVFDTLDEKTLQYITKDVPRIVKTVLPAARALAHTAGLGLSLQGIHMEDVGLIVNRDTDGTIVDAQAMLFDNTHSGFDYSHNCTSEIAEACNWCSESWFHKPDRVSRGKNLTGIERDFDNFIIHLLQPFFRHCPESKEAMKFFHSIRHCQDHKCMLKMLEDVPVETSIVGASNH